MHRGVGLIATLALSIAMGPIITCAFASDTAPLSVRVYADVCKYPRTGNVEGMRIALMRSFDGMIVLLETTEQGAFAEPLASRAKIDDRTHAITFTTKSNDGLWDASFEGSFDEKALTGKLRVKRPGPVEEPINLKRLHGDIEYVPPCTD